MNVFKIAVSHLYDGKQVLKNRTLTIEDGIILAVDEADSKEHVRQGLLIPGFIDVQVNGGGGLLI